MFLGRTGSVQRGQTAPRVSITFMGLLDQFGTGEDLC